MADFFNSNLKYLREKRGLSQNKLAELIGVNQTTIARWEDDNRVPTINNAVDIANAFNISLIDLLGKDLRISNNSKTNEISESIKIAILGTIKAGVPIEAQQDILGYIDIPKEWTRGGKQFYALQIKGDSMAPEYKENDIVIFEQIINDKEKANNKDCAIMVNSDDVTFKHIMIDNNGIHLIPLNILNNDGYKPTFYTNEQIENLPIKIVGIAVEKRTRL